jgi:hypothetical protein
MGGSVRRGGGAGGVGLFGLGTNGKAGGGSTIDAYSFGEQAGGGSGGKMAFITATTVGYTMGGGDYGGGGGGADSSVSGNITGLAANGAIRIIWPGSTRSFPYLSGK